MAHSVLLSGGPATDTPSPSPSACLLTVDRRGEGACGDALTAVTDTLRFWRLAGPADGGGGALDGDGDVRMLDGAQAPRYVLSTRVDSPHGSACVSALAAHPSLPLAVTCSGDSCDFKVWARGAAPWAPWRCRSVGFYQRRPMLAAAFSHDGSLLAVGAGDCVTLWEPMSNALVAVLQPLASAGPCVSFLAFPGACAGAPPLLCAASQGAGGGLSFWNVLSLKEHRRHAPLGGVVGACAADPASSAVAVVVETGDAGGGGGGGGACLLLFDGPNGALSCAWALRGEAAAPQAGLLFLPRAALLGGAQQPGAALLVVTADRRFALAATDQDEQGPAGDSHSLGVPPHTTALAAHTAQLTGAAALAFGSLRVAPAQAGALAAREGGGAGSSGAWASPFADLASHALPPLTQLMPLYMDALLRSSEPASA